MIVLRNFTSEDIEVLKKHSCKTLSAEEIKKMIDEWNTKEFNGHYFEMFAVENNGNVVGFISIVEKSKSIVSIGPEIFEDYRNQGLGKTAMLHCMEYVRNKSYKLVVQQIRENNTASLALHNALGFETDGHIFRNRHDNNVLIYIKIL